jgi:hypothetical protein
MPMVCILANKQEKIQKVRLILLEYRQNTKKIKK